MVIQVIVKCTNDTKGMQSAKLRQWESSNRTTQVTSTKNLQEEKIKEKFKGNLQAKREKTNQAITVYEHYFDTE